MRRPDDLSRRLFSGGLSDGIQFAGYGCWTQVLNNEFTGKIRDSDSSATNVQIRVRR